MPGLNTKTGTYQPNPNETPNRFLERDDPSRLLNISRQAANDDAWFQQGVARQNQLEANNIQRNNNIQASQIRQQESQNNFNQQQQMQRSQNNKTSIGGYSDGIYDYDAEIKGSPYLPRVEYKQRLNPQVGMMREQARLSEEAARRDSGRRMNESQHERYNQSLLDMQRQNAEKTQQAAQLAAQERLAQIQQQTSVLTGNAGQSNWRWF